MRALIIVLSLLLIASLSEARGSDAYQKRAQELFDSMSSEEAFYSRHFLKKIGNRSFPGTSSFIKPNNLCVYSNTIQTRTPRKECELFGVRTGTSWAYFDSEAEAEAASLNSARDRRIICEKHRYSVIWAPLSEFGSLVYKVDFYRRTSQNRYESDKYLGSHYYSIGSCDSEHSYREAVLNGGEFSGGSRKLYIEGS